MRVYSTVSATAWAIAVHANLEVFNKTLEKRDEMLGFSDVSRNRLFDQVIRED